MNYQVKNERSSQKNRTILFTEDDAEFRKSIELLLKKKGYDLILSGNGRETLELIENNNCDLLIMDIQLPEIDGISVVKTIRNSGKKYADVPIIMLSAYAGREAYIKAMEAGADSYLTKPALIDKIQYELDKFIA